jgi:propionyl-CoA synthetase
MNYKDFLRQKHSAARRVLNEQAEAIDWYRKPETILSQDENGTHFGIKMGN